MASPLQFPLRELSHFDRGVDMKPMIRTIGLGVILLLGTTAIVVPAALSQETVLDSVKRKVKSKVVSNTEEGFENLKQWLAKQGANRVHACCEATGTYSDAIALFLHEQGHVVSVVNPAQIAAYAQSQLSRTKTDALDAKLIARYCEREQPAA